MSAISFRDVLPTHFTGSPRNAMFCLREVCQQIVNSGGWVAGSDSFGEGPEEWTFQVGFCQGHSLRC